MKPELKQAIIRKTSAIIRRFFVLLWAGIKAPFKNIGIAIFYLFMFLTVLIISIFEPNYFIMTIIILGIISGIGKWQTSKRLTIKKQQKEQKKFFEYVFITMNFMSAEGSIPVFLNEAEVSEYISVFSFRSILPVSKWFAKKEELEMYFRAKITNVTQDSEDNRLTNVFVQINPLPEYIEWNNGFLSENNVLNIGESCMGTIGINLEKHPHAFVAGETGSVKSNILKCLIYQAILKNYEVVLIDFKRGVSFSAFSDNVAIYYDYPSVTKVLKDAVTEANNRLDLFRNSKVDNIADYNCQRGSRRISDTYLSRKIIFIDELAELLKTRDKDISNALYDSIETLTRLSRAVGIHLIMGIQRPDSTIVNGQIKNNVSFRICGRFVDKEPSRIMLSSDNASNLPNIKGRFLIKDDNLYEVQSFYFPNTQAIPQQSKQEIIKENIEKDIDVKTENQQETPTLPTDFEFDFSNFRK